MIQILGWGVAKALAFAWLLWWFTMAVVLLNAPDTEWGAFVCLLLGVVGMAVYEFADAKHDVARRALS